MFHPGGSHTPVRGYSNPRVALWDLPAAICSVPAGEAHATACLVTFAMFDVPYVFRARCEQVARLHDGAADGARDSRAAVLTVVTRRETVEMTRSKMQETHQ